MRGKNPNQSAPRRAGYALGNNRERDSAIRWERMPSSRRASTYNAYNLSPAGSTLPRKPGGVVYHRRDRDAHSGLC